MMMIECHDTDDDDDCSKEGTSVQSTLIGVAKLSNRAGIECPAVRHDTRKLPPAVVGRCSNGLHI